MAGFSGLSQNNDKDSIIKAFITNFISTEFYSRIINICLYPSEFNVVAANNSSIIEFIKKFVLDLNKTCGTLKINNYNNIKEQTDLIYKVLTIRDTSRTPINYQTVYQHLPGINAGLTKIVQHAIDNKITNSTEFRQNIDRILNDINVYNEISLISDGIINLDNLREKLTLPDTAPLEGLKLYQDAVVTLYNDLSKIKCVNKFENEKDYFVITDDNSIEALADSLINFISTDYNFYNTGYRIFDKTIDGLESSTVHLVSAP